MPPTEPQRASRTPDGVGADAVDVLLVDDEEAFARAVAKRLRRAGMRCTIASTLAEAGTRIAAERPDLIVLDMRLPDGAGLDLLAMLERDGDDSIPVVVLTAFGDLGDAVAAMKQRAADYLTKPIDLDNLLVKLEKVLEQRHLTRRLHYSKERETHALEHHRMLGSSPAMAHLRTRLERVQRLAGAEDIGPPTVLILGETGTGKDLFARTLHRASARGEAPFVHLDCASLPKSLIESELFGHEKGAFTGAHATRAGLIEAAENGTLFLDEIGELPLDVQSRLLAVLERRTVRPIGQTRERAVPAWFMAATNRDLPAMVLDGSFRADLFYRLNVLSVEIPPLRERREDVMALARHYAERTARRYGLETSDFDDDAQARLERYAWPGNVRELINVIERAVLLGGPGDLRVDDLGITAAAGPESTSVGSDVLAGLTLDDAERLLFIEALRRSGGNVSQAARDLGMTRMSLRYRLGKYGIDPKNPR